MKIVWTDRASRNRETQLEYIGHDSPVAAAFLDSEIDAQVMLLSDFPQLGRIGRLNGTRELVINHTPFIAVYSVSNNVVRILRLAHGAQNY